MMSESPPPPTEPPASPLNRWSIGTISILQVLLVGLSLIALNYLSARHFTRIDLSRDSNYTLSPATCRYLASDALSGRSKPVKWIMAFHRSDAFYERVRVLAEEYARQSHGKIQLEVVDALRSPDRTQQVMAAYELSLTRAVIIMDGRTDESAAVSTKAGIHELNPKIKLVLADDMVLHTSDQQGQRRASGFQGEDVLLGTAESGAASSVGARQLTAQTAGVSTRQRGDPTARPGHRQGKRPFGHDGPGDVHP